MNILPRPVSRRRLLGSAGKTILGGWALTQLPLRVFADAPAPAPAPSRVALTAGDRRADNILNALRLIEPQIKKRLAGKKRILVKPNVVLTNNQLSASHADCLEAILEFLTAHHKDGFVIADSSASGSAKAGFENYDYYRLARKFNVEFVDIDEENTVDRYVVDHRFRPQRVRMAAMLFDPDTFIVSSAMTKTHDRAVVTLSLKNIVVGAAKKDPGFRWGQKDSGSNDKTIIHGGRENAGINFNLFKLARELHPHLAVIDGFQGMEHNGPCAGTPVDHRVAVASTDWLAADRVATELMGFEFAKVGYLGFCAEAGLGEADLSRLEILGETVADHKRSYRPADNISDQYKWITRGD